MTVVASVVWWGSICVMGFVAYACWTGKVHTSPDGLRTAVTWWFCALTAAVISSCFGG